MLFKLFLKLHLQIYANQIMTSSIISLPFAFLNLESVEREKLQKFEYLKKEKSFLDEIKNIFWRPIIWSKNKNLTQTTWNDKKVTQPNIQN